MFSSSGSPTRSICSSMRGGLWERCERVETDRKSSAGALQGESYPISEANKGRTYRMSKTVFRDKTRLVPTLSCLLFLGITPKAEAQKIVPQCPTDCYKRVHIYNNTDGPIWFVIQAGFQNPDPWLQALLNTPIAETHYSRVYINLNNGIRTGESVTVELPWYSKLVDDPAQDQYADWWNGGRFVIFDNKDVVTAAYNADKANGQLNTDPSLLVLRCITS